MIRVIRTRLAATWSAAALFALMACASLLTLTASAAQAQAQDPSAAIMGACGKCHDVKRVCANLGAKDKAAWEVIVTRMMGKGAQIAAADKAAVVDWLAAQQAGAKPVCQ